MSEVKGFTVQSVRVMLFLLVNVPRLKGFAIFLIKKKLAKTLPVLAILLRKRIGA